MYATLNIILDNLKQFKPSYNPKNIDNPVFKGIHLLNPESLDLSSEYLYLCTLSEAMKLNQESSGFYYLCIRDRFYDDLETDDDLMAGIININVNIDMASLFNYVQNIFISLNEWILQMQNSLINNKGLQDLMDLSEDVMGNHIVVLDPALKLLAYTKNIKTDDPVSVDLINYGYHTEENIKKFRFLRRFERWAEEPDLYINESCDISKYPSVIKAFTYNNIYSIIVVMTCTHFAVTGGLLDLFNLLLDNIRYYVNRDYSEGKYYSAYGSFIIDLIEKKITEDSAVRNQAMYVDLPFNLKYKMYKIVFNDIKNISISCALQDIANSFPMAKPILYDQNILILSVIPDKKNTKEDDIYKRYLPRLEKFLEKYNACCGISNYSESLMQIRPAYIQASLSVNYGKLVTDKKNLKHILDIEEEYDFNIFNYEDYCLYHMIDCYTRHSKAAMANPCYYTLLKIIKYDRKNNSDNARILYIYLKCERKATAAANLLHMHRNNVIYRISKIQEMFQVNFDDTMFRLKFFLAYKTIELYGII